MKKFKPSVISSLFVWIPVLLSAQTTHTVCASGCNFPSIQAAVTAAQNGDNIAILDPIHTEHSIVVDKSLNICGGTPGTIVQAGNNAGTGNFRIFSIANGSDVTINDLVLQHGNVQARQWGGAIFNEGDLGLINCTIRNNNAHRGGAIYSSGILVIVNSTISGNSVSDLGMSLASGGGIYATGSCGLVNSTVSGNVNSTTGAGDGGGITVLAGGLLGLYYTTIANNSIGNNGEGAGLSAQAGSILDMANNIIADNSGAEDLYNQGLLLPAQNTTNIILSCAPNINCLPFITADPELQPLANNGGCTATHDLGPGSAAINAATVLDQPLLSDQRGAERDDPDIGAVEFTATTPVCIPSLLCEELLPVEYLSFELSTRQRSVVLDWVTAVEVNNEGFEIERSADGIRWEQIGFISGKGNSVIPSAYRHLDPLPLPGHNYYRLKQVDFDGQYEYSNILSVEVKSGTSAGLHLFPNPASESLTIRLPHDNRPYQLRLYNSMGQLVWEQKSGPESTLEIPVSELALPSGTYWLNSTTSATDGSENQVLRVLIQSGSGN